MYVILYKCLQWKKRMEKERAGKRFRAAGHIAQFCLELYESVTGTREKKDGNANPSQNINQ